MRWERSNLEAILSMAVTLLLLVALGCYIFSDEEQEDFIIPWPSVMEACMSKSDHVLRECIDEYTEQYRRPED